MATTPRTIKTTAPFTWTLPCVAPLLWTGLFVGSIAVPSFIPVFDGLVPRRWGIYKRSHLRAVAHDLSVALSQSFLAITLLAHQSWLHADAVIRTLVRLHVTRRNLLEWVPAQQAAYGADPRLGAFYWHLRAAVVVAAAMGLLVALSPSGAWLVAAPFVLLWVRCPPPSPGASACRRRSRRRRCSGGRRRARCASSPAAPGASS